MRLAISKDIFRRRGALLFILVIFSALVLFFNAGKRGLWEPDEGRYAEMSREMVESGDWLTPRLNYIKHFDKPPLTYWLIGSSFKLFGFSEFAAHLPLLIIALAAVLAAFLLGERLFGRRCGFLSAIILVSSLGYPAASGVLSTDIIFSCLCLLSYLFFIQKNYLLFFLSMALGFMTKGPVVFIITLIPICIFLICAKEMQTFKQMPWAKGLLLFALVALPWFFYQCLRNPGLLYDWTFQQTLGRIIRPNVQPFYFFIPVLAGSFFPWIFFLISALLRRELIQKKTLLLLFWFFVPFLFFSCIGKKLVPYILPLFAPLAIITGRLWDEALDNPEITSSSNKGFAIPFYIFLSCLGIFAVALVVFLAGGFDYQLGIGMEAARKNLIALSVILTGAIPVIFFAFRLKKTAALFSAISITSICIFLTVAAILPKIETNISKSIKPLALKIKQGLRPEDKVVNYRCFLKSLPFYLSRRTIVVERQRNLAYEEGPEQYQDYLLKDKNELYKLLSAKGFKVYCLTYTWEFEKIKAEYPRPLELLGRAGKYVLFVNKK